jgi:hypothetical protein
MAKMWTSDTRGLNRWPRDVDEDESPAMVLGEGLIVRRPRRRGLGEVLGGDRGWRCDSCCPPSLLGQSSAAIIAGSDSDGAIMNRFLQF